MAKMQSRGFLQAAFAAAALVAAGSAAQAAPSQESMRKAFSANLAGTWGDVGSNGSDPTGLPNSWELFGCGDQPAYVITGSYRSGFMVKAQSMETGPAEGQMSIGQMDSKNSARVGLPGSQWEQRLTIKNSDLMVLDSVESDPDAPSRNARYLKRCR